MIATLSTLVVIALLIRASQVWWRSHLNPVTIGLLAWTPGLIMLNWPPFFLSPLYIHLNRPTSPLLYLALGLALASFWAGCATVRSLSHPSAFRIDPEKLVWRANLPRVLVLFAIGLAVFLYAYVNSGLLELQYLDDVGVAESRLRLHLGWASFLISFMDIAAIAMLTRLFRGGSVLNAAPMIIAMICQGATLQKSRFVFLLIGFIFVAALHPRQSYAMFLKTPFRRMMLVVPVLLLGFALLQMNVARGIAAVQMTSASNAVLEQVYIYSGAAALQNLSVTIEGYLPSQTPAFGAYLARPILWHFWDKDFFFATRYFEGINAATYLIYGWADFRWLGFGIMPFLVGVLVMLFLRAALRGSLIGLVLGVLQMQAVIYSSGTDVLFDPTASVVILLGIAAWLFADFHWGRRRGGAATVGPRAAWHAPPPGPALAQPGSGSSLLPKG